MANTCTQNCIHNNMANTTPVNEKVPVIIQRNRWLDFLTWHVPPAS